MEPRRVLIMGAAGRDFHNFNTVYRDNSAFRVVGFTATQIPNIEGRVYPPELAGSLYPEGIPIFPEEQLPELVGAHRVDTVVFAYSDVSHEYVMHRGSTALAAGADFELLGPNSTMVASSRPVVAITAGRTGSGKSQTTRHVAGILRRHGKTFAVIRHPMPYGNLSAQAVQEYRTMADLGRYDCTIEEREEYEPHLEMGSTVYAGIDYQKILRRAEQEHEVIVWDGGNNDLPFYRPDLHIAVVDPHRPGHELRYHPGETNVRMAHVVVINKVDTAPADNVAQVRAAVTRVNPRATIIEARSPISLSNGFSLSGARALVVEDGPTLTHGDMSFGAGVVVARAQGAAELIDPRPYAVGTIADTFARYPHIGPLLPAMGYGDAQIRELEETINASPADVLVVATPIDLTKIVNVRMPAVRATYRLEEVGQRTIEEALKDRGIV
ncbi:MAG TPA: cyclic 2,3-diphosphoglycerate synthase [Chloroflexota bacterium]|nr:cyclic 2,3-diphosphoglycerate synthase [Chloroflexota bacterium]